MPFNGLSPLFGLDNASRNDRGKPSFWAVNPALVDPKWGWFWREVTVPLIFNEKQVGQIINSKYPTQSWSSNGASGQDVFVRYSPHGSKGRGEYLTSERSGDNYARLGATGVPGPAPGSAEPQSFFFYCAGAGVNGRFGGEFATGSSTFSLRMSDSEIVSIVQSTSTRLSAATAVPVNADFSMGFVVSDNDTGGDTQQIYINGVLDANNASDTGWGSMGNIIGLFGNLGASARNELEIYCFYQFNNNRLTARKFKQLHDDPFGPFRKVSDILWLGAVAAAAGGDGLDMPWPVSITPPLAPPHAVGY